MSWLPETIQNRFRMLVLRLHLKNSLFCSWKVPNLRQNQKKTSTLRKFSTINPCFFPSKISMSYHALWLFNIAIENCPFKMTCGAWIRAKKACRQLGQTCAVNCLTSLKTFKSHWRHTCLSPGRIGHLSGTRRSFSACSNPLHPLICGRTGGLSVRWNPFCMSSGCRSRWSSMANPKNTTKSKLSWHI